MFHYSSPLQYNNFHQLTIQSLSLSLSLETITFLYPMDDGSFKMCTEKWRKTRQKVHSFNENDDFPSFSSLYCLFVRSSVVGNVILCCSLPSLTWFSSFSINFNHSSFICKCVVCVSKERETFFEFEEMKMMIRNDEEGRKFFRDEISGFPRIVFSQENWCKKRAVKESGKETCC